MKHKSLPFIFLSILTGLFTCISVTDSRAEDSKVAPVATICPEDQAQAITDLFDTDKDGKISKDEYAHATMKMFESMDKDSNNAIHSSEMSDPGDESLKEADTDGDSKLSFSEILKYQEKAFNDKDLNHDGYLAKDEITECVKAKLEKQAKH